MNAPLPPNPSDLDQRLAALRQKIAARPSMAPAVAHRIAEVQMNIAPPFQLRRFLMRASLGLAACIAISLIILALLTDPTVAFSQILEKVDQTKSVTCDFQQDADKSHLVIQGQKMRMEKDNGVIYIMDFSSGEQMALSPKLKIAVKQTMRPQPSFDVYALLHDYKDGKEQRLGEKQIAGRKVIGFQITRVVPAAQPEKTIRVPASAPGGDSGNSSSFTLTVWVDPATNLPVEVEGVIGGHDQHFRNLKFDEPLKEDPFAMTLPEGWQWQQPEDQGKLNAPPTTQEAQSLIIQAGIGVGPIKLGDNPARIVEIMGKPEHESIMGAYAATGPSAKPAGPATHVMQYPSKGLEIRLAKDAASDLVVSIRAYSKASSGGAPVNDFPGTTDQGIAIGASPDQIKAAYGEPTKLSTPYNTFTLMEYDGINFSLTNDKVTAITIVHPNPKK